MRAPDFWQTDGPIPRLLDPLGKAFGIIGHLRRYWITPTAVSVPVICIGNLTSGGAGKTPTAIALAHHLKSRGHQPHFLTRGYGGRSLGPVRVDIDRHDASVVGDEALLLAKIAPCWVSKDRVAGAKAAMHAGADVIVLDDGYQNPHLAYDLSLLVIDGAVGFGNQRLIPAGPLREAPASGFSRADALVVIGGDDKGVATASDLPKIHAELKPSIDKPNLQGKQVVAFAGIGRPKKFFETLQGLGAVLVDRHTFPDHYRYKPSQIEAILQQARQVDAVCVTTEKDHVRLPLLLGNYVKKLPIELHFEATDVLDRLLSKALKERLAI